MNLANLKTEIGVADLQKLIHEKEQLTNELAQLKAVTANAIIDAAPHLEAAVSTARFARRVFGFWIANWHYDDIVGWPWRELLAFVDTFEQLPGLDDDDREWAVDTRKFCKGAHEREIERATRQPGDKPRPITL